MERSLSTSDSKHADYDLAAIQVEDFSIASDPGRPLKIYFHLTSAPTFLYFRQNRSGYDELILGLMQHARGVKSDRANRMAAYRDVNTFPVVNYSLRLTMPREPFRTKVKSFNAEAKISLPGLKA